MPSVKEPYFSHSMLAQPDAQLRLPCRALGLFGILGEAGRELACFMRPVGSNGFNTELTINIERDTLQDSQAVFRILGSSAGFQVVRPIAWGRVFSRIWISCRPAATGQSRTWISSVARALSFKRITIITTPLTSRQHSQVSVWLAGCAHSVSGADQFGAGFFEASFRQDRGAL